MNNTYAYIGVMALTTFLTRALPIFLVRGQIKNSFIRSFLFYVPYVTLAVMTFPAIIYATDSLLTGLVAFGVGLAIAWKTSNIFITALASCLSVLILSLI